MHKKLSNMAISLLKEIIEIPALSKQEQKRCNYLYDRLKQIDSNIKIERVKNNLLLLPQGFAPDKKTLMLCSHIDTVAPATEYALNPYVALDTGDKIMGLGSNDDGGSVVCQIVTFLHLCYGLGQQSNRSSANRPDINLILAISAEEEIGGEEGINMVLKALRATNQSLSLPYPDVAIVGEPTGMYPAIAEKGLIVLDGLCTGKSAHVAVGGGKNAIYQALEDIRAIRKVKFERVSEYFDDVKVAVTQIEAGQAHNVIPDSCHFVVDVRPTDRYTNEEIVQRLQRHISGKLIPRSLTHRVKITPEDCPLIKTIKRLGLQSFQSPTTSDWSRLDMPAIKMGPGSSGRSHKADEFIYKSEIEEGIEKYIKFVRNLI